MDGLLLQSNLLLFIPAAFILLITPGPAVLYIITRSVDQGRRAGIVSVLGIQIGTLTHVFGAALGLSAILVTSALAFDIVKYLGAAYLIYLGIRTLLNGKPAVESQTVERKNLKTIFSQGVIVAILNPKTALFFFAFLPQFVDGARGSVPLQFLLLGAIFVGMALVTDSIYALLAGTAGRRLKGSPRFLRAQRYITGTIYIGLGVTTALASGRSK